MAVEGVWRGVAELVGGAGGVVVVGEVVGGIGVAQSVLRPAGEESGVFAGVFEAVSEGVFSAGE